MKFDRKKFFSAYRKSFGTLTQQATSGLEFLLSRFEQDNWQDIRLISYVLATCKHEAADTFQPIKEYRARAGSKSRANQDRYWLTGYYGRGYAMITWLKNYAKLGNAIGADLAENPELALVPNIAFEILVVGMLRGLFTGKKLSDYITPTKKDYKNARRIINGTDKAALIAGYAEQFESILKNSLSTPLPNARAASLIPATGNVETVGAPVNADTVSDDTDKNEAAHDAAPPNSTTQTAENITNVDNSGDAAKIEAAKTAPVTEADTHSHTGFLAKVTAIIAAIATGQYAIPAFVQTDSFLASSIKFFEALFHGVFVLRYFVFGSLALWFVLRKVELFSTKIAAMRVNSDPSLGNITLVAPPPKPPLFERIFGARN